MKPPEFLFFGHHTAFWSFLSMDIVLEGYDKALMEKASFLFLFYVQFLASMLQKDYFVSRYKRPLCGSEQEPEKKKGFAISSRKRQSRSASGLLESKIY